MAWPRPVKLRFKARPSQVVLCPTKHKLAQGYAKEHALCLFGLVWAVHRFRAFPPRFLPYKGFG